MFETRQASLRKRIDVHYPATIPLRFLKGGQHSRMVRAGILTNHKDRLSLLKIFQQDRALTDADGLGERGAARFVAHVRAVRQVVGSKLPHKELVEESSFITGSTGSVKDGFVRRAER